jgi:hypothetical protein
MEIAAVVVGANWEWRERSEKERGRWGSCSKYTFHAYRMYFL